MAAAKVNRAQEEINNVKKITKSDNDVITKLCKSLVKPSPSLRCSDMETQSQV